MKITKMTPIITTDKLAEEKEFYTKFFGFKVIFEYAEQHIGMQSSGNDDVVISFMAPNEQTPPYQGQGVTVCLEVEDVEGNFRVSVVSLVSVGILIGRREVGVVFFRHEWLGACGLFEDLADADPKTRLAAAQLMNPAGMGTEIKVLVQGRGVTADGLFDVELRRNPVGRDGC